MPPRRPALVKGNSKLMLVYINIKALVTIYCERNGCRYCNPCQIEEVHKGAMYYWVVFHRKGWGVDTSIFES